MTDEHESEKGSARRNWVSLIPFGLHQQHPNNYKDILDAVWENHERPAGQTTLMIPLQLELDRPLRPLESGPIEHRGTELPHRCVEGSPGVFEPEPAALQGRHSLAMGEDVIEEGLVQLPGPMRSGIGQR